MRSLVVDFHAGCIHSLYSTLEQDHETHIASYSQHDFVIEKILRKPGIQAGRLTSLRLTLALFGPLGLLQKFQNTKRALVDRRTFFGKPLYDIVWCCFPPGIYMNLVNSRIAAKTIVVISHRMDMGIHAPKDRANFWSKVKSDLSSCKVTFVAANQYDAKYFEYYTNVMVPIVEIQTPYSKVAVGIPELPALIGPSHINSDLSLVKAIKEAFPNIQTIKECYPSYGFDQLSRHKAFIILPYSVYSISMLELSNLGVPILVPSDELLLSVGLLNDVTLFPLYGNQQDIKKFENECSAKNPGPNCDCITCRKHWLQFAFWKSLPNAVSWNSISELKSLMEEIESSSTLFVTVPSKPIHTRLKDVY